MSLDNSPSITFNLDHLGPVALTDDQIAAARKAIAGRARGAADAAMLLDALGIGGDQ